MSIITRSVRTMSFGLWVACAQLLLPSTVTAAESLADVQACSRANLPASTSEQSIQLTSLDPAGTETQMQAKVWVRYEPDGRDRILAKLTAPQDLADAAYLVTVEGTQERIFTYLPAMDRVKRIQGKAIAGRLWGTDLNHADMQAIQQGFLRGDAKLTGSGELQERKVDYITLDTSADGESHYSRIKIAIDQLTCVVLEAAFEEQDGKVKKRLTVAANSLQEEDGKWTPRELEITDLEANTSTRIKILKYAADVDIPQRAFNSRTFYQHR